MLCKNKQCKKGNFDKRAKFEPRTPSQVYCCADCLLEDRQTESYKKAVKDGIKRNNASLIKERKIVVYEKENKKYLQNEINKLARMIDAKFGYITCICCNKSFGKQIDSAHFSSRGSNSTLRYNLHNLHSAKSDCNQYSNTHLTGYKEGLATRYGIEYQDYVVNQLPLLYKEIHLSAHDIVEKLAIVRKVIRTLDKMLFKDAIEARDMLNTEIGIYTINYKQIN